MSAILDLYSSKKSGLPPVDTNRLTLYKYKGVTYGKNSLTYQAGVLWNSIDVNTKNVDNVDAFKQMLKVWQGPPCRCGECLICLFRS